MKLNLLEALDIFTEMERRMEKMNLEIDNEEARLMCYWQMLMERIRY